MNANFIEKLLIEANLENDYASFQKAQKFIEKAKDLISQFPNKFVSYNPEKDFSLVKVGHMTFQLAGKNNSMTHKYEGKFHAAYDRSNNVLSVFDCDINYNKNTRKLTIEFPNENEVIHELTHFLDLKRSGKKQQEKYGKKVAPKLAPEYIEWCKQKNIGDPNSPLSQSVYTIATNKEPFVGRDFNEYVNDYYELNAHFIEYIIPQINKYIQKEKELPASFNEFKDDLFNNIFGTKYFRDYFNTLTENNKKKFLKRIGIYYQQLRNFTAKEQHVDFKDKDTTRLTPSILNQFTQKIKGIFKNNKAA